MTLKTERLILRPWHESELEPFAKLNSDPRVREYFPSVLCHKKSNDLAIRIASINPTALPASLQLESLNAGEQYRCELVV